MHPLQLTDTATFRYQRLASAAEASRLLRPMSAERRMHWPRLAPGLRPRTPRAAFPTCVAC